MYDLLCQLNLKEHVETLSGFELLVSLEIIQVNLY